MSSSLKYFFERKHQCPACLSQTPTEIISCTRRHAQPRNPIHIHIKTRTIPCCQFTQRLASFIGMTPCFPYATPCFPIKIALALIPHPRSPTEIHTPNNESSREPNPADARQRRREFQRPDRDPRVRRRDKTHQLLVAALGQDCERLIAIHALPHQQRECDEPCDQDGDFEDSGLMSDLRDWKELRKKNEPVTPDEIRFWEPARAYEDLLVD